MDLVIRKTRNKNEWSVRSYNSDTKKYIILKRYDTKEQAQKHIDDLKNDSKKKDDIIDTEIDEDY
jgi:bifunctional DNA-binding transcriptional regulator/antitoxin component of YhaV-PrlF toxin-antitoxin module